MIEKLKAAAIEKIEAARSEILLAIVQLKLPTMQQIGEHQVMLKAKYEGLGEAIAIIEDAHAELMGKEPDEEKPEKGPYE